MSLPRLPPYDEHSAPAQSLPIEQIRRERGRRLLLWRVLLNSPPVARFWKEH